MILDLAFDTETTGKADFKSATTASHQPHLVQLGAILFERDTGNVRGELNVIVNPGDDVEIPQGAIDVHGLSRDVVRACGVPPVVAVRSFMHLTKFADRLVCHNTEFDYIVMRAAGHRTNSGLGDLFAKKGRVCTMRTLTDHLKLPGNYGKYKWPSLAEAYSAIVDSEGFDGAHDAMADVRACKELYRHILGLGLKLVA